MSLVTILYGRRLVMCKHIRYKIVIYLFIRLGSKLNWQKLKETKYIGSHLELK